MGAAVKCRDGEPCPAGVVGSGSVWEVGQEGSGEESTEGLQVGDLSCEGWRLPSLSEHHVKEQGLVGMAGSFQFCKC